MGSGAPCDRCEGTGQVEVHRCPRAISDPMARRVIGYVNMLEAGILPVAGGWEDQSASFAEAAAVAMAARADIEERTQARPPGT